MKLDDRESWQIFYLCSSAFLKIDQRHHHHYHKGSWSSSVKCLQTGLLLNEEDNISITLTTFKHFSVAL